MRIRTKPFRKSVPRSPGKELRRNYADPNAEPYLDRQGNVHFIPKYLGDKAVSARKWERLSSDDPRVRVLIKKRFTEALE